MSFLDELRQATNKTLTENFAVTNKSTLDPVLDYFSRAGAMRGREEEAVKLFTNAFNADKLAAVRTLFYLRDVRGGQGERSVFRSCYQNLWKLDRDVADKLTSFIPEYGRWDDLIQVSWPAAADLIKKQLDEDEKNMKAKKPVSLLAKWLPSENASSNDSRRLALNITKTLGLKPSQYRKKVVALRKYIKLLEQQMSAKAWKEIQYDKLPSQAHRKHVKAFKRNDESRYEKFLDSVKRGEKKINSKTLFTYEIYDMVNGWDVDETTIAAADEMWKALPDYTNDTNALVLADVSGSMEGRPISISTSLAVYFAERNKGPFKGFYMTFTDIPEVVQVSGGNIQEKLNYVEHHNVGYNTDLAAAFDAILRTAINSKAKQEEMPSVLYIISDMEFDDQMSNCGETNFETAKRKFEEAGYKLPHVVFWNVDSRNQQAPATKFDDKVTLISGSNQSTFKYVVEGKSPLESMGEILNSERYAQIVV